MAATGEKATRYGFPFSDLTQRLLSIIAPVAYPSECVKFKRVLAIAQQMNPTLPF